MDLLDIKDVRLGWKSDVFNVVGRQSEKEHAKDSSRPLLLKEECCFSIVLSQEKSLDLVASDRETAAIWVKGLKVLVAQISSLQQRKNDQRFFKNK